MERIKNLSSLMHMTFRRKTLRRVKKRLLKELSNKIILPRYLQISMGVFNDMNY
jgi:hypothetical protein